MQAELRLLQFSPAPEILEPVNVALIVSDRGNLIHYDKRFPRLAKLARDFNVSAIVPILEDYEDRIRNFEANEIKTFVRARSGQWNVSEPRLLTENPKPKDLSALIRSYLGPIGKRRREPRERKPDRIESFLDHIVSENIGNPATRILSNAHPDRFLSSRALNLLGSNGFSFSRVVSGKHGILILDGIDATKNSRATENQMDEIAYAFFRIRKRQAALQEIEGRNITLAAVAFGADKAAEEPHVEFGIRKIVDQTDLFVDLDTSERLQDLKEKILEAQ